MAAPDVVGARDWYETIRMADDVTLIHEPWIKPFFRCNMWHVRGRDRDLLFDTGLGHFSLRRHVPLVTGRPIVCVASHTHFDHIGSHHEFDDRRRALDLPRLRRVGRGAACVEPWNRALCQCARASSGYRTADASIRNMFAGSW